MDTAIGCGALGVALWGIKTGNTKVLWSGLIVALLIGPLHHAVLHWFLPFGVFFSTFVGLGICLHRAAQRRPLPRIAIFLLLPLVIHLIIQPTYPRHDAVDSNCVVVTGSSTGIGRASAYALASLGYHVYAGVRKQSDADKLVKGSSTPERITPLIIDVTSQEQINEAVSVVRASGRKLIAVVNNAGIGVVGIFEAVPYYEFDKTMQTNHFGTVRVTKSFLPLLRHHSGRIINVSSLAGLLSLLGYSVYSPTKYAMEAFTDALRQEVLQFNVPVSLVEPGGVKTEILSHVIESIQKHTPLSNDTYLQPYQAWFDNIVPFLQSAEDLQAPVDGCVRAIVHAVSSSQPLTRYLAGIDAHVLALLKTLLPDRALDKLGVILSGL